MNSNIFKQQLLDELYKPYQACNACPLGKLGRTQVVFGTGNPNAKLMFIGEGPGRDEDIQGAPFVGRSGKLLDRIFEMIGISRSDVFITNIVKCRPPENRKPAPIESSTCKKLLLKHQINIIQPKIICTLGAAAIQGLLDEYSLQISKIRGKPFTQNNYQILPTFHPAYILRNPKELSKMADDILLAHQLSQCK